MSGRRPGEPLFITCVLSLVQVSLKNLRWGILGLDRMGKLRDGFGELIEPHLYPKYASTSVILEWFLD
jgi:hypothetical protein